VDYVTSDEEVADDGHRQSGEGRGDRTGPDPVAGERQTLLHEAEIPLSGGESKFLRGGSSRVNFASDLA
jgi:hypothetical protein